MSTQKRTSTICGTEVKGWKIITVVLLLLLVGTTTQSFMFELVVVLTFIIIFLVAHIEVLPEEVDYWMRFLSVALLILIPILIWMVLDFIVYHLYDRKRLGE